MGALPARADGRDGQGTTRGLRRHGSRTPDRQLRRGPVQLVRAQGSAAVLGPGGRGVRRLANGVPHPPRVPHDARPAPRALHPVRGRRAVAEPRGEPRRRPRLRAPDRLPGGGSCPHRCRARRGDDHRPSDRRARSSHTDRDQGEGPAAAPGGGRAPPRRSHTPPPPPAADRRRAEREDGPVRGVRRALRAVAREAELPRARTEARTSRQGPRCNPGCRRWVPRRRPRRWRDAPGRRDRSRTLRCGARPGDDRGVGGRIRDWDHRRARAGSRASRRPRTASP